MRCGRRRADGRTWRRRRKARSDAGNVQRHRSRPANCGQIRVRREAAAQSRKSVSRAPSVRGAGPDACAWGRAAVPGYSEVLESIFLYMKKPHDLTRVSKSSKCNILLRLTL